MTLTLGHGPLAQEPRTKVNYRLEGPDHRLFFDPFPRRVRALFGGEIVLDSRNAMLLHETTLLPQLYVPMADLREDCLAGSDHTTRCPFKGRASYWTLQSGERSAPDAVWSYEEPTSEASWLKGYCALAFDAADAWFDEDQEIAGNLRDPYHRVDVRESSRHVRILAAGELIADTTRPKVLSETGLPNRYYIPPGDVRRELLEPSATHTVCPYKGTASYVTVRLGDRRIQDAAWFYPAPLEGALEAAGHLAFNARLVDIEVDGQEE